MSTLNIRLPWPPSTNHFKHYGRGTCWLDKKTIAFREATSTLVGDKHIDAGTYEVIASYHAPNRRSYDLDNRIKQLLDALVSSQACPDDKFVRAIHLYKESIDPNKLGYVDVILKN